MLVSFKRIVTENFTVRSRSETSYDLLADYV